jgi:hypothetical protein
MPTTVTVLLDGRVVREQWRDPYRQGYRAQCNGAPLTRRDFAQLYVIEGANRRNAGVKSAKPDRLSTGQCALDLD